MLPFRGTGLSVCLSVRLSMMYVHCAKMAEDTDLTSVAYNSPVSVPDRVKIWLTSVNSFLSKFWPKLTPPPVYLSIGNIPWQTAAKWPGYIDSAVVADSMQETTTSLLNGAISYPLQPSPSPK